MTVMACQPVAPSGSGRLRSSTWVAPVSPAQQDQEVAAAPAPEQKKRGFWSRIFGKGRDDKK